MSRDTYSPLEGNACGRDWAPRGGKLYELALRAPIENAVDKLVLLQIAYTAQDGHAIFCLDAPENAVKASVTKLRGSLDRLQHQGYLSYVVDRCRCSGEMRSMRVIVNHCRLEVR